MNDDDKHFTGTENEASTEKKTHLFEDVAFRAKETRSSPSESDVAQEPINFNIETYLNGLRLYELLLRTLFNAQINPSSFLSDIGGEKFVDARLVINNKRAENYSKVKNDPELFQPSRMAIDTEDLFRHLERMVDASKDSDEEKALRVVVPMKTTNPVHTFFCEAERHGENVSLIVIESASERVAWGVIDELAELNETYPRSFHNASVIVINTQKSADGCPSHAIVAGSNYTRVPHSLRELHGEQATSNKGKIKLIVDSFGNRLDWRMYLYAQSLTQTKKIDSDPRYQNARLSEEPFDEREDRKRDMSLLDHHHENRTTEDVLNIGGAVYERRPFGNAIDCRRLNEISHLIKTIEHSIEQHGRKKAGEIFRKRISDVWLSGRPNPECLSADYFAQHQPAVNALCMLYLCEKLPVQKQLESAKTVLDQMVNSRVSPDMRAQSMHVIESIVNRALEKSGKQAKGLHLLIDNLLSKVPDMIRQLSSEKKFAVGEFAILDRLNSLLIQRSPFEKRMAVLQEAKETLEKADASYKYDMGGYLMGTVLQRSIEDKEYHPYYGNILLSAAIQVINSRHGDEEATSLENKLDRFDHFNLLLDLYRRFGKSTISHAFHAVIELVVNLDKKTLADLLNKNTVATMRSHVAQTPDASSIDLSKVVSEYKNTKPDWQSFSLLKRESTKRKRLNQRGSENQSKVQPFDRIDLDSAARDRTKDKSRKRALSASQSSPKRKRRG